MSLEEDIAAIARQEAELRFDGFDENDAFRLGQILREEAGDSALAIEIRTPSRQLYLTVLPGSTPDNGEWMRRKANTVLRVHRSSYGFGKQLELSGGVISEDRGMAPAEYVAHGGSFPIHVRGVGVVAAATVSGLPQREDHRLVVRAICRFLGVDPAAYDIPA